MLTQEYSIFYRSLGLKKVRVKREKEKKEYRPPTPIQAEGVPLPCPPPPPPHHHPTHPTTAHHHITTNVPPSRK